MKDKLKWGIIGLGKIARQFAEDALLVEGIELFAVASRSIEKAKSFSQEFGIDHYYGSYEELLKDNRIDIVYIATPHNSHSELSIKAMEHKKHVLCEKPFAVNASQAKEVIRAANAHGVFIMEALWTRFNPSICNLLQQIDEGDLGEINYINADFNFTRSFDEAGRMLNPELAGGALLDIGIYPLFLAYCIMGMPDEVIASGILHKNGVDLHSSFILKYKNGIASLNCGFLSQSDMVARVCGSEASAFIRSPWHYTDGYEIIHADSGKIENYNFQRKGRGYSFEIEECLKCISEGKSQSASWSLTNSLDLIMIMDEIRKQIGVRYPFEEIK